MTAIICLYEYDIRAVIYISYSIALSVNVRTLYILARLILKYYKYQTPTIKIIHFPFV